MEFNAVVLADIHDKMVPITEGWLKENGFNVYTVYSREDTVRIQSRFKDPFLFLENPYVRVENPKQMIETHKKLLQQKPDANTVSANDSFCYSVVPGSLRINDRDGRTILTEIFNLKTETRYVDFKLQNESTVILYTHNRDPYLKLSLNSLLFSLPHPFPLKIFLNEATDEVKKTVKEYQSKHPWIDVIEVNKNAKFAVSNLAIQWLLSEGKSVEDPITFWEDDFILPIYIRHVYPNWLNRFVERLQHIDIVGWISSLDNGLIPFETKRFPDRSVGEWIYQKSGPDGIEDKYILAAHGLTTTIRHWLRGYSTESKTAVDSNMIKQAKWVGFPSVHGYHIGWNQQMDGFGSVNGRDWGLPSNEYILTDVKKGSQKVFNLDDIEKYR